MDAFIESLLRYHSREVLNYYLKKYNQNHPLMPGKNFSNPFLKERQKTPSFNIYYAKNSRTWRYKDFATGDQGNCIEIVKQLHKLSFKDALAKIKADMPELLYTDNLTKRNKRENMQNQTFPQNPQLPFQDFTQQELDYWQSYGITSVILKEYNVRSIEAKKFFKDKNKPESFFPVFAYPYGDAFKIYQPFAKTSRFYFKGTKSPEFIFGFDQLPESGDYVIITGGEKDVMSLKAHGFPAIALNSETAIPSEMLLKVLKERFDAIIILYDNDKTGIERSKQLSENYALIRIELPIKDGLKDISDFFKANFPPSELEKLIDEALKNTTKQTTNLKNAPWSNIVDSPCVSDDTYQNMPFFIQDICLVQKDNRSRDVALFSALPLISGCLPNITGVYDQRAYSPHLFTFIIAPAASGKGNAGLVRLLGEAIEAAMKNEYKEAYKRYKEELKEYNRNKDNSALVEPVKPRSKSLFLPGNASSAALLAQLEQNGGTGIIFESEADSAGNALKNDWGNYSDMLRKAFHHEAISQLRKSEPQKIEVQNPALSVCLTSTISQVGSILKSAEDGLFSRFGYYIFSAPPSWRDVSPSGNRDNLNEHYTQLGRKMKDIHDYYQKNPAIFELSANQWEMLNLHCEKSLKEITALFDENASSIVKRLGLIWFRIAMNFSAIRAYEAGQRTEVLACSDSDFSACKDLFEILLDHSKRIYLNLPKHSIQMNPSKQKFYEMLPIDWFTNTYAYEAGRTIRLSERTVREYLKQLIERGLLEKGKIGNFRKLGSPDLPTPPEGKVA